MILLLAATLSWGAAAPDWQRFSVLTPAGPEEPPPEVFRGVKRLLYGERKVQRGDNRSGLAKAFGTTEMSLQTSNNNELILMPSKLVVLNQEGLLYRVRKGGETLDQIAARYHRDRRAVQRFKEAVVALNRLPGLALMTPFEFPEGTRLLLPKITINFDSYQYPFSSPGQTRISSYFGTRYHPILKRKKSHDGLDLPKPWGTPVYPSRTGQVVQAGWHEGYGQLVVIRHSDGFTTRYGHLSKIMVKEGQLVSRGRTMIGRVGSTGLSTGPHLHFEVRDRNGRAINPRAKIGRR